MNDPIYLTLEQVLFIHEDQIERYGGARGIRDLALLESAIFRPQTTFAGKDLYNSHPEKAAALMHSLVMNHAFVDGNKRTGAAAMLVYLAMNGIEFGATNDDLIRTVLQIEHEKWEIEKVSQWLNSKIR